jgi:hypothetical protein
MNCSLRPYNTQCYHTLRICGEQGRKKLYCVTVAQCNPCHQPISKGTTMIFELQPCDFPLKNYHSNQFWFIYYLFTCSHRTCHLLQQKRQQSAGMLVPAMPSHNKPTELSTGISGEQRQLKAPSSQA